MLRLRAARRQAIAFVAGLALLCAQAVGLAHAVAHPQGGGPLAAEGHDPHHDHGHDHGPSLFDAQHDEGSAQCQLLDQLSHGDGLAAPALAWRFAAPQLRFAAAPAAVVHATCACGYHARGPPSFLA
jgi:hypothetical protein